MHGYATYAEARKHWHEHTRKAVATDLVPANADVEVCAVTGICFVRTVDESKIFLFRHNDLGGIYCELAPAPKHWTTSNAAPSCDTSPANSSPSNTIAGNT